MFFMGWQVSLELARVARQSNLKTELYIFAHTHTRARARLFNRSSTVQVRKNAFNRAWFQKWKIGQERQQPSPLLSIADVREAEKYIRSTTTASRFRLMYSRRKPSTETIEIWNSLSLLGAHCWLLPLLRLQAGISHQNTNSRRDAHHVSDVTPQKSQPAQSTQCSCLAKYFRFLAFSIPWTCADLIIL